MFEGTFSGKLGNIVDEAFGFTQDCGREYDQTSHVLSYIERVYDGGLEGFVLDVQPLW